MQNVWEFIKYCFCCMMDVFTAAQGYKINMTHEDMVTGEITIVILALLFVGVYRLISDIVAKRKKNK